MVHDAKALRKASKKKAQRLAAPHKGDIDASGWKEPTMNTEAKTGLRPVSPRAFKRGGKVEGKASYHHAGHKPRKASGGEIANAKINRNVKEANGEKFGNPRVGALKHGGRAHKAGGGDFSYTGADTVTRDRVPTPPRRPKDLGPSNKTEADYDHSYTGADTVTKDRKHGGRAHKMGGGPMSMDPRAGAAAMMQAAAQQGNVPTSRMAFGQTQKGKMAQQMGLKRGGKAEHDDEVMDRKLIDKMVKPSARTGKKDGGGNWIQGAIKHPGALHKALHVPKGEKIPEKKLEKAEHSNNPHLAKKARLAETLKSFHHAKGGKVHHPADCKCEHCTGGRVMKHGGEAKGNYEGGTLPTGDRIARKHGGPAKGKGSVNIIISTGGHPQAPGAPSGPPPMPAKPPGGIPVPVAPPGAPMGAGAPPMMPPPNMMPPGGAPPMPMGRKHGGRAYPIEDGAGGGKGRLEKIKAYGLK